MLEYCFHDPDVVEITRKGWGASAAVVVGDAQGNALTLLEMPRRLGRYLVSPYEAGIALSADRSGEARTARLLEPLVERLEAEIAGARDVCVQIRASADFVETRGHAILEPFLRAGFRARLDLWERVVDLRLDPDEILAHAAERVRRKLRRGLAEQPKVELYFGEGVSRDLLRDLFEAAAHTRRAGGAGFRHDVTLYTEDRAALIAKGKAVLAVCDHDGFRGYVLALVSRDLGYYWDGAWSGTQSPFANHFLHYRVMLFLKELGVRRYSLGYVFPGLLAGSTKEARIAFFKDGFGDGLRPVYTLELVRERRAVAWIRRLAGSRLGAAARRVARRRPRP
jgi:hypothetical protein